MKNELSLMVAGIVVALSGCGGGAKNLAGKQTPVTGDNAPAWAAKASYEEGGRYFYRGAVTGRADMALGLREARAEAEKSLAEELKQKIRTEFGSAVKGENFEGGLGSHVFDIIAKVTESVQVSGAKLAEQYTQKVEERTSNGVRYIWDCYALVSLTREDYLDARRQALQGAIAKAREERNAKAEEALKLTFQKLDGESRPVVVAEKPKE